MNSWRIAMTNKEALWLKNELEKLLGITVEIRGNDDKSNNHRDTTCKHNCGMLDCGDNSHNSTNM